MREFLLRESFRTLYFLVVDPRVSVTNYFDVLGNIWMLSIHRNLNDWELGELCRLLGAPSEMRLDPSSRDGWEVHLFKGKFHPQISIPGVGWLGIVPFPFLIKAFGSWISLLKLHFFFGMLVWIKFSLLIIYKAKGGTWLTSVYLS